MATVSPSPRAVLQPRLLKAREYQQIPQLSREESPLLQGLASSSGGPVVHRGSPLRGQSDLTGAVHIEPTEEDQEVTGPHKGALKEAGVGDEEERREEWQEEQWSEGTAGKCEAAQGSRGPDVDAAQEAAVGPCPLCGIEPFTVAGELAALSVTAYQTAQDANLHVGVLQAGRLSQAEGCCAHIDTGCSRTT